MKRVLFRTILLLALVLSRVSNEGIDLGLSMGLPRTFEDAISRAGELLDSGLSASNPHFEVGTQCLNHTEMFLEALVQGQPWAIRMIDAMGKLPSGLLDYHTTWLGSYDECVAIEASMTAPGVTTSPYKGRYCKADLKVGPLGSIFPSQFDLNVGLCVPYSCSTEDTSHLIETFFSLLQINTTTKPPLVTCQYERIEYNTTAKVVLVVCSLFALLLVSATAYDVILTHWLNRPRRSPRKYVVMRQTSTSAILPGENDTVPSVTNHTEKYGSTANGEIATTEPVANGHAIDDTDKNVQQDTEHGKQENAPDDQLRFTQKPSLRFNAEKTNIDSSDIVRFQETAVDKDSHEKIQANRILEAPNSHFEDDGSRFESDITISEMEVSRIRRTPENAVFDEEEIATLTDIAIQQCPYNAFCHRNRTIDITFRTGYGPCCKDCFCDERCGERMDCCWDFLDTIKIEERIELKCVTPVVLSADENSKSDHSYLMIDSCHGNDSYQCSEEDAAIWGPLFPASSEATSMIYFNRYCAKCNGVTDSIPWETYISCNSTDTMSASSLMRGLKRKLCTVRFRPSKNTESEKFACAAEAIRTCSLTEWPNKYSVDLQKACQHTKANVDGRKAIGGKVTYANIFCKLCNGQAHRPTDQCRSHDIKSPITSRFITFVDWGLLDTAASNNIDNLQKQDKCRENEIKHPTKMECRPLICPNGAIRTPNGCKLFVKTWFLSGYEIHVILTPAIGKFIPLVEFLKATERVQNINDWLDTKGLDINSLIMYAEDATGAENLTSIGVINMRLGSDQYPINAQKLIKAIGKSMSKQWIITIDKTEYTYNVAFDIYDLYIQNGMNYRRRWFKTNSLALTEPFILPKVYTMVTVNQKMVQLRISKMYFCEKIELHEMEWVAAYSGIWLNLTGSGNDSFLGNGEFSHEIGIDGATVVKMEICVDDFLARFGSSKNEAYSFGYTMYQILFLELFLILA